MPELTKNFATSTVATAPSPATSGTSLVVAAGEGARFPTPPFNAIVCPVAANPVSTNAEIVRVTGVSTDTFTIVRAQESSTARSVIVGDRIYAGVTALTLADLQYRPSAPTMALTKTAAQTAIVTGGFGTDVDFDSTVENFDPGSTGVFTADLTNNWILVNFAGYVLVSAIWVWAANSTGIRELYLNRDNSSAVNQESRQHFLSAAVSGYHVVTMPMLCAVGDRLKVTVRQTSGGNLDSNGGGIANICLRATMLSLT